jgi:hypothetical protein
MKTPLRLTAAIAIAAFAVCVKASPASPKDVVEQFVKMDVEGVRLTPQGWRAADMLFAKPSEPFQAKVVVVIGRSYAVSTATGKADSTEFYFGYEEVARISTSSLRFAPTNSGIETRSFEKYIVVSSSVGRTKENRNGSSVRIDGAQPTAMHLTAEAAIRYVTLMRDKTTDPEIRRTANQTLVKLKPYR